MSVPIRMLGPLGALAALLLLAAPALAQTGLSPEVVAQIRQAAAASRQLAAREVAIAQRLGNRDLAATTAERARQRADAALTSTVVAIIAADRSRADEVVAAAVAEAPESRASIVAGVAASFPTLGSRYGPATAVAAPGMISAPVAPVGGAAPAGMAEAEPSPREEVYDPLETINRGIFFLNDTLDTLILRPIAVIYGFVMPEFAKQPVRNFFSNLESPVLLANDLLQFTFDDAAVTTGRFVINSTIGVLGLFDVAEDFGLEAHHADFGQTMHSYGVGQGLYVMMPVFGPSTARDAIGTVVDGFFQPLGYFLGSGAQLALSGTDGMVQRESLIVALDDLKANSLDYYAALRGAYYQDRAVELNKGKADKASTIDAMFEGIE